MGAWGHPRNVAPVVLGVVHGAVGHRTSTCRGHPLGDFRAGGLPCASLPLCCLGLGSGRPVVGKSLSCR
eukprot:9946536-Prorocentrum_lima.AAC.1